MYIKAMDNLYKGQRIRFVFIHNKRGHHTATLKIPKKIEKGIFTIQYQTLREEKQIALVV